MKYLLLFGIILFYLNSFSQWKSERINNGIDASYVTAHTDDYQTQYLRLENYNGIVLLLGNTYICSEMVTVNLSFLINGVYSKHDTRAKVSMNHKFVFIVSDLSSDSLMLEDFKNASILKIRINDPMCDDEVYDFSMVGSMAAYAAVVKQ